MWYVNSKSVWANLVCVSTLTNVVDTKLEGTKLEWTNLLAVTKLEWTNLLVVGAKLEDTKLEWTNLFLVGAKLVGGH